MIVAQPPRRAVRGRVPALCVAALLAVCCTGTAIAAVSHVARQSSLAGKWKGSYGGAVSGHFSLHWTVTGSDLTGKISLSNPKGTYDIGGSVHHGKIKFGAVGVGATYKGTRHGSTMSGTWTSPEGGGTWSAHAVS